MIGQVIGNYRLVSELGKGGMGVVYVAEHVQLGRPAALKMLLPQFSSDEAIVQRFFNEARAASAIDHPGIVEIYDFGKHTDGRAFIVMALLKGETLQERLTREPLAPVEGATIVAQVASALAVAHARGIVHRDLKPDNIFLVPNELMPHGVQAKLLDFGIAKLADERASFKTQTGSLIGTPAYMSPEQCMGRSDLDHRTDLYALGCILFHVLCGRPPFISDAGAGPMIAAHLRDPAPDPRAFNPYVSDSLAHIVLRLLEKDPARRFQTALELRDALMLAGANVSLTRQMPAETQPTTGRQVYRGPEAYHPTTAPTTNSGSAAQVVARADKPSRAGLWIGLAVVAVAAGGIATVVAVSTKDEPATQAAQKPELPPTPESPVKAEPTPGSPVKAAPTPGSPVKAEPTPESPGKAEPSPPPHVPAEKEAIAEADTCPPGQARTGDTKGHCCWPEQAWSTAKNRCVGAPRCAPGMLAKADTCVAASTAPDPAPGAAVPRFTLNKTTYAPGEDVDMKFAQPVPSSGAHRAWVTIVEAGKRDDSYGGWEFVADNAREVKLQAPSKPGAYEARVHTDYSTHMYNLRYRVRFEVAAAPAPADVVVTPLAKQRFSLDTTTYQPRETVHITFPTAMHATKNERFWITIVKAGAVDSSYGEYEYVQDKATTATLTTPATPGEYEVRLHANYPTKSTNVVYRVSVQVR